MKNFVRRVADYTAAKTSANRPAMHDGRDSVGTSRNKRKAEDPALGYNYIYTVPSLKVIKRNPAGKLSIEQRVERDVNLAHSVNYFSPVLQRDILDKSFVIDVEPGERDRQVFTSSDDENTTNRSRPVPVDLDESKDELTLCSIKGGDQEGVPVHISINNDITLAVPPVSISSKGINELGFDSADHSYPKYDYASDPENSDPVRNTWVTTKADKVQLHKSGHTWKKGKWTQEEVDLLKSNIDKYCKEHGIDDARQIIYHASKDERPKFYPTIAAGLNRPVFAVYRRVKRMYDSQNYRGKYTPEEVKKLKDLHAKYGRDWTLIGQEMGRSSDSVKDRCRLVMDSEHSLGKWSEEEELRLARAVYSFTGVKEGTSVTSNIVWTSVAEIVGTRTEKQCRAKWLNYLNWKMCDGKKWTKSEDAVLLERIIGSGAENEEDINWQTLSAGWKSSRSPQWLRIKWWSLKQIYLGENPSKLNITLKELLIELSKIIAHQITAWDRSERSRKVISDNQAEKDSDKEISKKLMPRAKIDAALKSSKNGKQLSLLYVDNPNTISQDGTQNVLLVTDQNNEVQGRAAVGKDPNGNLILPQFHESDQTPPVQTRENEIGDEYLSKERQSGTEPPGDEHLGVNTTLQLAPTPTAGVYLVQNSYSSNPLMLVLSEDVNSVDFTPEMLSYINNAAYRGNVDASPNDGVRNDIEEERSEHGSSPDELTSSRHDDVITTSDVLVYQETSNDDDVKNSILDSAIHVVTTAGNHENDEDSCFIQGSSPLQGTLLEGTDLASSTLRMDVAP